MRILVVGAGAVGQVYARHLQRGGAQVAFLVRPKYAEEARRGFDLYPLNEGREPVRLDGCEVLTSLEEVRARTWDAVFLCVSTTALRAPGFLDELAGHIGEATLVTLQPGLTDARLVAEKVGAGRVVAGMIGLMAYAAPLPGEKVPRPGTAYWFPPLGRCPLSGPEARVRPLVALLRRGGFPARRHKDVVAERAFGGALLDAHVTALERAGWDLAALRRDRALLGLAHRAGRETVAVSAGVLGVRPPRLLALVGPGVMRLALGVLGRAAPFDVGTFFRVHYTKIGDQSRYIVDSFRELAAGLGLAIPAFEALHTGAGAGVAA